MRFNAGYFGAFAVTIALLGTVLGGFVLSLDRSTESYSSYNYITDVSGLFSYTDTPEYIDYNPSTNYVGYIDGSTTPKYENSTTANNYRYVAGAGAVWTSTYTIDESDDYGYDYAESHGWLDWSGDSTVNGVYFNWNGTGYNFGSATINGQPYNAQITRAINGDNPEYRKVASLQAVLQDILSNNAGVESMEITVSYNGSYPVLFYTGDWRAVGGIFPRDKIAIDNLNEDNSMPTKIIVNTATLGVQLYRNATLIYEGTSDNVAVLNHVSIKSANTGLNDSPVSVDFSIDFTGFPTYAYMNPNAGVTLNGAGYIDWENGYHNNEVTIKMIKPANNSWIELTVNGSSFRVGWVSGTLQYWTTSPLRTVQLGDWLGVQFTLNGSTGDVTFTPLYFDLSLTDVAETTAYSVTDSDLIPTGDIDTIRFMNTNVGDTYPRWQVVKTTVFLNTYNTVMHDPSLDITDYFPDLTDYRLNFYSFALYGDSFDINGTTFTVDRNNATVSFDYNGTTVTQKLNNVYVSTDGGNTFVTFANVNQVYDLGATSDDTISFNGYWYFTTGLYEPVTGIRTVYNWDLDGAFHADAGQCLIVFFAILGGSVLIAHVYGRVNLRALDWIVIVFAGFFAYVYFGGLIV